MRITDEAVEAAGRTLRELGWQKTSYQLSWDGARPTTRERYGNDARVALEAALPHLTDEREEYSDLEYATRLDGTTMPAPTVLPNEYCWCGGEVGARSPGDHLGLGCLANIMHNWTAASQESQDLIEAECSLEGCSDTRPHYHRGDDEMVVTGPYPATPSSPHLEGATPETRCNCGFGGFHDDANPRCDRNRDHASAPSEGATPALEVTDEDIRVAAEQADEWRAGLGEGATPAIDREALIQEFLRVFEAGGLWDGLVPDAYKIRWRTKWATEFADMVLALIGRAP
jgi:hypothetical protein